MVLIIRKGQAISFNASNRFPCCRPSSQMNPKLSSMMTLLGDSEKSNLVEKCVHPRKVGLPGKKECSDVSMERAHLAVFKMEAMKSTEIKKEIMKSEGGVLDVQRSVEAAYTKILQLSEKAEKQDEELTGEEKRFLAMCTTKAQHFKAEGKHGKDSKDDEQGEEEEEDGSHSSARTLFLRNSERMPEIALVILSRFLAMPADGKLLAVDLCSGTGSVARALMDSMFNTLGVQAACVSVEISAVVTHFARAVFTREAETALKNVSSAEHLALKQKQSAHAKDAQDLSICVSGSLVRCSLRATARSCTCANLSSPFTNAAVLFLFD